MARGSDLGERRGFEIACRHLEVLVPGGPTVHESLDSHPRWIVVVGADLGVRKRRCKLSCFHHVERLPSPSALRAESGWTSVSTPRRRREGDACHGVELDESDAVALAHDEDPATVSMVGLMVMAWARKPA